MATAPKVAPAAAAPAAAPQTDTDGNEVSNDKLIATVQTKVRESVPPQFRVAVQKIYLAGMKAMYSPDTHQLMLQQLQGNSMPDDAVAKGVSALITILFRQSKGTMPIPAAAPAAILLVCEALDYLEQTKQVQVTPDLVSSAVQQVVALLMQKIGMTPDTMASTVNQSAAKAGMHVPGAPPPITAASVPSGGLVQSQMGA